jgi:hypothetical protein
MMKSPTNHGIITGLNTPFQFYKTHLPCDGINGEGLKIKK